MRGAEHLAGEAGLADALLGAADRLGLAGEDDLPLGVDGGDDHVGGEQRLDILGRGRDGEHRAARHLLHQPAALGDRAQAVLEGEDAGDRARDELAEAVAEHGGRATDEAGEDAREDVLERVEERLRDGGLGELLGRPLEPEPAQVAARQVPKRLEAAVAAAPEGRVELVEAVRHARHLRPLAGEGEGELHDRGHALRRSGGEKRLGRLAGARRDDGAADGVSLSPDPQRARQPH